MTEICFIAEKTLGKLAKWLRILGYDVLYEKGVVALDATDTGRIRLTRTKRVLEIRTAQRVLFISANDSFQQLMEVVQQLEMNLKDFRPFTRCIRCNTPIEKINKDLVKGRVPDYIYKVHDSFKLCRRCDKIYWPGSHTKNTLERVNRLFPEANKNQDNGNRPHRQVPDDNEKKEKESIIHNVNGK